MYLRRNGFSWSRISALLHISRTTLYKLKLELNINEVEVELHILHSFIMDILRETPNAGEVYILGSLRARGLRVPRWKVREQLQMIDPVGRAMRRGRTIQRRVYCVRGANHLW